MLNQQPQDFSSYFSGNSLLSSFTGPAINIGKMAGAFFGVIIIGNSTNLVGNLIVEGAAQPASGLDVDYIWCPLSSDAINNFVFASTSQVTTSFDVTSTQAKFIRLRYVYTSGTGTTAIKCDGYLKPL